MNIPKLSPRTKNIVFAVGIIVIVTIFFLIKGGGLSVTPNAGETSLSVTATENKETKFSFEVKYEDIDTIQVVEISDLGECISGEVGKNYTYGTFKNDQYGEFQVGALTKLSTYVEIRTLDGKYYLCNFENKDTTSEFCRALKEYIEKK